MKKPVGEARATAPAPRAHAGSETGRPAGRRVHSNAELVHELEVHQAELEMQNEELRHTQLDLLAARDRFVDLYDFAPVGYFTLNDRGMVIEANLTGAAMLGCGRKALLGRGFSRFVAPAHATLWHQQMRQAMLQNSSRRVDLALQKPGGETLYGQLDCQTFASPSGPSALRVTLTDVTQRKMAEMERRTADSAQNAREAERRHFARELHEGLGQRLSALKMELGSLPLGGDMAATQARVAMMLATLDEAVASVRRIAIELRPLMLDDLGLGAAIEWLANDAMRRLGIEIKLDLHVLEPEPDERSAIAMYRIAQDILGFVAHDGKSAGLTITLMQDRGELLLKVQCQGAPRIGENDGDPAGELTQGLLDRANLLGGRIELRDAPARAPSIVARIPMVRQGADPQAPVARATSRAVERPRAAPARYKASP